MVKITMKKGDRLPVIEATIKKKDGTALDLTNATAKFIMVTAKDRTGKISASATITDATGGKVKYEWAANDTNTAGDFLGEFEITYADGKKIAAPSEGYIEILFYEELG